MNFLKALVAITTVGVIALTSRVVVADTVLIDHDFTDGAAATALNGEAADTFNIGGESGIWAAGSSLVRDGSINATTGTKRSAYLDIGSAITKGNADSIFELEVVFSSIGTGTTWLAAGFFNSASPSTATDMIGNGGVGWFLWRGDGEVEPRTGAGAAGKVGDLANAPTNVTQTFTIRLDLSAWDGTTDFGGFGVYDGTSLGGTLLYSGAPGYDFLADTNFLAAGFSTSEQSGTIDSFKLTQIGTSSGIPAPAALPAGLALLGLFATRRRR